MTDKCIRCGICCFYLFEGKIKRCKFLRDGDDGLTYCKVYRGRMNRTIDENVKCNLRKNIKKNFDGCPYNKEEYENE